MAVPDKDELSKVSVTELTQAYAASVQAAEATEHIGRKNRLARQCWWIVQELKARGAAHAALRELTDHSDSEVRRWAKSNLDGLDKSVTETAAEPRPKGPYWQHVIWQCDHPPPPALTREEIAQRLRRNVPEFCERLMALALPAIGLWPQRRTGIAATASRLGGMPLAPPDWQWPMANEEPRLFVGQINCAERRGLPGADLLPSSGLLAFFGDHDAVTGCFPFDSGVVFHWRDIDRLVPAKAPTEPAEIFPSCALVPRPFLDLPHPDSRAVREFGPSQDQRWSYWDVWEGNRLHGIPKECVGYAHFSKLLGWPALLQSDLCRFQWQDDARLLLQVDAYCNGEEAESWGPGGTLYDVLPELDLQAQVFEGCELEGQFT